MATQRKRSKPARGKPRKKGRPEQSAADDQDNADSVVDSSSAATRPEGDSATSETTSRKRSDPKRLPSTACVSKGSCSPTDDSDDDEEQSEDEEEVENEEQGEDEEEVENEEQVEDDDDCWHTETTVNDDDPELVKSLQRTCDDPSAVTDVIQLLEHADDDRAMHVKSITEAAPTYPKRWPQDGQTHELVNAPDWKATVEQDGVTVVATPRRPLALYLGQHSPTQFKEHVPVHKQSRETVRAAFELCRLRILLALFDTTVAELDWGMDRSHSVRLERLLKFVQRTGRRDLGRACTRLSRDPELCEPLIKALFADEKMGSVARDILNYLMMALRHFKKCPNGCAR